MFTCTCGLMLKLLRECMFLIMCTNIQIWTSVCVTFYLLIQNFLKPQIVCLTRYHSFIRPLRVALFTHSELIHLTFGVRYGVLSLALLAMGIFLHHYKHHPLLQAVRCVEFWRERKMLWESIKGYYHTTREDKDKEREMMVMWNKANPLFLISFLLTRKSKSATVV